VFRSWLAREKGRNDRSLGGLWPLATDLRDHSGRRAHPVVADRSGGACPSAWGDWLTPWYAATNLWGCSSPAASSVRLVDRAGRVGFDTAGKYVLSSLPGASFPGKQATGFSAAGWVYLNSSASGGLFSQTSPGAARGDWSGWEVAYQSGGRLRVAVSVGYAAGDYAEGVFDGSRLGTRWAHVVAVFRWSSGSTATLEIELYVDGRPATPLSGTSFLTAFPDTSAVPHLTGASRKTADPPYEVDDFRVSDAVFSLVRVYGRPLSTADVGGLYRREEGAFRQTRRSLRVGVAAGLDLFLKSGNAQTGSLDFVTAGGVNAALPLLVRGISVANANFDGGLDLSVPYTAYGRTGSVPFYVGAVTTGGMNLSVAGGSPPPASGGLDLSLAGTATAGLAKAFPLAVTGDVNARAAGLNLYLPGPDQGAGHAGLNLSVAGAWPDASVPLYVLGAPSSPVQAGGGLSFALAGPTSGTRTGSMNMVLKSGEAVPIPFVLYGPPHTQSQAVNFALPNVGTGQTGSVPMAVAAAAAKAVGVKLYANGF
jgi:hypothetical protein